MFKNLWKDTRKDCEQLGVIGNNSISALNSLATPSSVVYFKYEGCKTEPTCENQCMFSYA